MFLLSTKLFTVLDFRFLYKSSYFNFNLHFSTCCIYFQWKVAVMIFLKLIYNGNFAQTQEVIFFIIIQDPSFAFLFNSLSYIYVLLCSLKKLCKVEAFTSIINSRILFLELSFATTLNFVGYENAS